MCFIVTFCTCSWSHINESKVLLRSPVLLKPIISLNRHFTGLIHEKTTLLSYFLNFCLMFYTLKSLMLLILCGWRSYLGMRSRTRMASLSPPRAMNESLMYEFKYLTCKLAWSISHCLNSISMAFEKALVSANIFLKSIISMAEVESGFFFSKANRNSAFWSWTLLTKSLNLWIVASWSPMTSKATSLALSSSRVFP